MNIAQRINQSIHWTFVLAFVLAALVGGEGVLAQSLSQLGQAGRPTPTPRPRPRDGEELPPYVDRERPLRIFDEEMARQFDPIRDIAIQMQQRQAPLAPPVGTPMRLLTYEYELQGESREELVREAHVRALESAAGRLYLDNYFLLGLDVFHAYVRQYGSDFIVSTDVLGQRQLADDQIALRLRVSVDLRKFYNDLRDKRFLAEPNLRPIAVVHLAEEIDGRPSRDAEGRQVIENTLQEHLFPVHSRMMRSPALNVDLSRDPELLQEARLEAQRHDADVLITGIVEVQTIEDRTQILFDEYSFQQAEVTLRMYRIDTGELLHEIHDRYSASAPTREEAISSVLDSMLSRATRELALSLRQNWGKLMLDDADYRLMLTGVDEESRDYIANSIKRLSPEIQIFSKIHMGDTWVVNLTAPDSARGELERFLRDSNTPRFRVEKFGDRHFVLQVL